MFRLRNFALMAILLSGIGYDSRCHAQVDCLEYPLYYDGVDQYLFVAEQYDSNSTCLDEGEVYVWATTEQVNGLTAAEAVPEACSPGNPNCVSQYQITCTMQSYGRRGKKGRWVTTVRPTVNKGALPKNDFMLGDKLTDGVLQTMKTPKNGIKVNGVPEIIWVYATNSTNSVQVGNSYVIPIKVFSATLNYGDAGVASGNAPKFPPATPGAQSQPVRNLLIGIEVSTTLPTIIKPTLPYYSSTAYAPTVNNLGTISNYHGTISNVPDPTNPKGNIVNVTTRTYTPLR